MKYRMHPGRRYTLSVPFKLKAPAEVPDELDIAKAIHALFGVEILVYNISLIEDKA